MMRRFTVLLAITAHCACLFAQDDIRPIAEIRFGAQYFFADQLRLIESEGPYADIMGTRGTGHGLFGEARWSHGRERNRAIGLRVELEQTPIGHAWITRAGDVWGHPIPWDGKRQGYVQLVPAIEAFGTYTYDLFRVKRYLVQGSLGLGGAYLPGNERIEYYFGFSKIHDDEHPNFNSVIYRMNVLRRTGVIPTYRAALSIGFELPRQNRLYAKIFHSGSFVRDAFRVDYTMYPGTAAESRGQLQQSLGTLGLSLSYGISHGPPKKPRRYADGPPADQVPIVPDQADTIRSNWTRNALSLTYGHFWHQRFRFDGRNGADLETYRHWGRALALHFEHRLERGIILGGEAQFDISGYLTRMKIEHPLFIAVHGTTGTVERGVINDPNAEFMLFVGRGLKSNDRWRLDAHFLAGIAPGVGVSSGYSRYMKLDSTSLPAYSIMMDIDQKLNPMLGLRLNGAYRLGNHDRLVISLEARTSLTDYYTGHFAIYPSPDDVWAAQGELRGKLAYAGVRFGYAITMGAPRKPRWMRQQERYSRQSQP